MAIKPDFDTSTDLQQFNDAAEYREDFVETQPPCYHRNVDEQLFMYSRRIDRHRQELDGLKVMLKANTETTEANNKATAEVLEIVTMGRNFFKVLGWVGAQIGPLAKVGIFVGAFYFWARTGKWEWKP
jgi:hypothetical protein